MGQWGRVGPWCGNSRARTRTAVNSLSGPCMHVPRPNQRNEGRALVVKKPTQGSASTGPSRQEAPLTPNVSRVGPGGAVGRATNCSSFLKNGTCQQSFPSFCTEQSRPLARTLDPREESADVCSSSRVLPHGKACEEKPARRPARLVSDVYVLVFLFLAVNDRRHRKRT